MPVTDMPRPAATADLAFDALGDPTRRHIFESLRAGPRSVGQLADGLPVSRPAVSQHLRVLRENGFARVRAEGTRRLYAVDDQGLREVDEWLDRFRRFWSGHLDALATELARGKRERRLKEERP